MYIFLTVFHILIALFGLVLSLQVPLHTNGMLGDALNLLLTPSHILDNLASIVGANEYILAQKAGKFDRDCSRYYAECPASMFEVLKTNRVCA